MVFIYHEYVAGNFCDLLGLPYCIAQQPSSLAEKNRELIASFAFNDNVQVTASFGVATLNANETLEQLFNNADFHNATSQILHIKKPVLARDRPRPY